MEPMLVRNEKGLALTDGKLVLQADFTSMLNRIKKANLEKEMLVKAAGVYKSKERLKVLDATAGLGEDSLLLAAAGCKVDLYEADEVIAALLEDAVLRANDIPELAAAAGRMKLHKGDSIAAMKSEEVKCDKPDVIYLDPMFPERQKSASVKKKFQLIHGLEKPCENEEEMILAAMELRPKRIVVKRPTKGPYLGGRKPDYSYEGKAIRYDIYVFA